MKNLISALKWMPEVYIVLSVIYYWLETGIVLNPIPIFFIVVVLLQLFIQNRAIGILISVLFILVAIYMLLALLSEVHGFPNINQASKDIMIYGFLYLGTNLLVGIAAFIKYINFQKPSKHLPLRVV